MIDSVRMLTDELVAADVQAFFAEHPIEQAAKTLDQVLERQRVNTALRAREQRALRRRPLTLDPHRGSPSACGALRRPILACAVFSSPPVSTPDPDVADNAATVVTRVTIRSGGIPITGAQIAGLLGIGGGLLGRDDAPAGRRGHRSRWS